MLCSASVRPSSLAHTQFTWCQLFATGKSGVSNAQSTPTPSASAALEPVSWPFSTDIHCWHCTEQFENAPAVAPVEWNTQKEAWTAEGCFCSWACALRWLMDSDRTFLVTRRIMHLHRLARKFGHVGRVVAAPPRLMLRKYGGTLDISAFRAFEGTPPQRVSRQFIPVPVVFQHHNATSEQVARVEGLRRPLARTRADAGTALGAAAPVSRGAPDAAPDGSVERKRSSMYARYLRSRQPSKEEAVDDTVPMSTKKEKRKRKKPRHDEDDQKEPQGPTLENFLKTTASRRVTTQATRKPN